MGWPWLGQLAQHLQHLQQVGAGLRQPTSRQQAQHGAHTGLGGEGHPCPCPLLEGVAHKVHGAPQLLGQIRCREGVAAPEKPHPGLAQQPPTRPGQPQVPLVMAGIGH